MTVLETQGLAARHAARALAVAGTARKNAALEAAARAIEARQGEILAANAADLEAARAAGLRPALLDRLALDEGRIAGIVEGVRQVAALPDPIGAVTKMDTRPNGLTIGKRRVPLGVIGIIYEARPNVTVDAAALCLKSGNAALLRGGKEAFHSNQAFVAVLRDALEEACLPRDCVALVADTSRESANELMGLTEYLDVLIPRGGAGLIRSVVENARVPVIQTGVGVCHIYVHERADLDMAARILHNAKTSRPSVCNAAECVLVDRAAARDFLPLACVNITFEEAVFGCEKELEIVLKDECTTCHGTGAKPGTSPVTCPKCHGEGQVVYTQQSMFGMVRNVQTCPDCHGSGKIIKDKCTSCRGTGYTSSRKKIQVSVPAGIDNGQSIRIREKGEPGTNGGPRGDLLVEVNVARHPIFQRQDMNIFSTAPLTYAQAALGGTVRINTVDGEVEYEVKPGTQTDTRIRLKGKGVPSLRNKNVRGDHYVTFVVQVPTNLNEEAKEALRKFDEACGNRPKSKDSDDFEKPEKKKKSFMDKLKETFED